MPAIDVRHLARRLHRIESIAWIPSVASTNDLGRRVAVECIDNETPLPSALIVAGEQTGGRGRGARRWHSPACNGIYLTLLHRRKLPDLALLPLEISILAADFLREVYGIEARLKWPNDLLIDGRKIAGILIDARNTDDEAYLAIGIGINVQSIAGAEALPNATSIAEESSIERIDTGEAIEAFAEFLDQRLGDPSSPDQILTRWNSLTIHQQGDAIECIVGDKTLRGRWGGIDDQGRAILLSGEEKISISAGDIVSPT
ncbi:MAG TPA: biotin--[acetyl-CoA-carboxylase] ligase [Thermoanaerobaculia bacterium]|nr:biotin--[acetyl-CoA-carboxylase] ligase [Thermoanaerobaculia bacterium]